MTNEMVKKLRHMFLLRYYVGENDESSTAPTWDDICSSAGVERRDQVEEFPPKGFVEIPDPSPFATVSSRLRMTEETAMKILALGEIP
jgi:hypothetical protein